MKGLLLSSVVVAAVGILASPASAATTAIDGHFKETYPKKTDPPNCFTGAPCGLGHLRGLGQGAETFVFESSDGFDANGCETFHGTTTIALNDAQQSFFQIAETDKQCSPGKSHESPGQHRSFGNPFSFTGTWSVLPGTGTGIFANVCGGSGKSSGNFAGSVGAVEYSGSVTDACA